MRPAKFHAIPTLSPMMSTSISLLYAVDSGAIDLLGRPLLSLLLQLLCRLFEHTESVTFSIHRKIFTQVNDSLSFQRVPIFFLFTQHTNSALCAGHGM